MATSTESTEPQVESPDGKEERRPYVVVLMSAEMKEALKAYASQHSTNPTALGRQLFADAIGYDISTEPQPTATRQKYTTDDERAAAKKRASLKSGLLRKALFQMHNAQLKSKTELLAVATQVVSAMADPNLTTDTLTTLDASLDAAIKAGK